jgi:VCBS repeat-containing protein
VSALSGLGAAVSLSGTVISYDPSGALDYLAEGEIVTDTFTYTVTDEHGATDTATVSFDVLGVNDGPAIVVGGIVAGAVQEDVTLSISGDLDSTDVDNGATAAWSVAGGGAGTYGSLGVDASTGTWTYTLANGAANVQALAANETHDEVFTVVVTDEHGATDTETVTVTVTGTNDDPVITPGGGVSGTVQEDGTQSATGDLDSADVDNGSTATWSVQGNSSGVYGDIAVDTDGNWTYTLDNNADHVQALAANESHDEVFTVAVTDDQGATDTQDVTVTVNGTNDAPEASDINVFTNVVSVSDGGTGSASSGGNIFLTGHDVLLHGHQHGYDTVILDYLRGDGTANEIDRADYDIGYLRVTDRGVPGGTGSGFNTSQFGTVTEVSPFAFADNAAFATFLSGIDVLYIPWVYDVGNQTGSNLINSFAPEIEAFINAGGDIAAESSHIITTFYDFLPPAVAASGPAINGSSGFTPTAEGTAIGITSHMVNGSATHNQFIGFDDDFTVFETRGSEAISIGVQNATVTDGGITTAVSDFSLTRDQLLRYVDDVDNGDTIDVSSTSNDQGLTSTLNADDSVDILISESTSNGSPIPNPTGDGTLINGLGGTAGFGENVVARNDDGNSGFVDLSTVFGDGLNFFGTTFSGIYINTNGNISFGNAVGQFTPSQIGSGISTPIIAPYWADVDTRGGTTTATPGGTSTGQNQIWYDLDDTTGVLTVTWDDVGYYSNATNPVNAFQLQLLDRGNGDFDVVFRYEDINWTTGGASGGSGGLGGTPARAGYSAGNCTDFFELPTSGNQSEMLELENSEGNFDTGIWAFQVRDGGVSEITAGFDFTVTDSSGATDTAAVIVNAQEGTTVTGAVTDDILISDTTDDLLTGAGGDDLFVFSDGHGADTVTDFQAGAGTDDALDLSGVSEITDLADLLANHATDVGANMEIDTGNGNSVTLIGVNATDLHQDDFLF